MSERIPTEFAVVGGGVNGLAVAWHLVRGGRDVLVLEAADRAGGTIRTLEQHGARLEQGPQSLRGAGPAIGRLVDGLELTDRIVPASSASDVRYVLHRGRLAPLPSGPLGLLRGGPLKRRALLGALLEPLRRGDPRPGESIDAFVRRRFGAGIAEPVLDAFIAGIYAGDARQTEAEAAFPALVDAEKEHGSVILGQLRGERAARPEGIPRGAFSFDEGIETLTDALAGALGDRVRLQTPVHRVTPDGDVHLDGAVVEAEHIVVTTPPHVAATQVEAWGAMRAIPASPVAAVHLGWPAGTGPALDGFGWLAPTSERRDVLGCIWVSSTFPHLAPGWDLLRVMIGGSRAPFLATLSDRALARHALDVVRQVQGPVADPELVQVAAHLPGIPQYVPGHSARRRALEGALDRVHPLGWGLSGIGLSQGLASTEALAERLLNA